MKNRIILILIVLFAFSDLRANESDSTTKNEIIKFDGALGLNVGSYNVDGISPRDRDFRYSLTGGVNVNLLGIDFPFSVLVSEQQRSYTQPSNQYGVSPNYKWITVHAGWRSLSYSPFTLAGHSFLGGGFDLTPGDFRISAMYGRFNKATSGGDSTQIFSVPAYERTGFAAKLGYGSSSSYIDLIILKAKDNVNSLDSTNQTILKPAENMVFGVSSKLNLFSSIFFEFDASSSFYTNDIRTGTIPDSSSPELLPTLKKYYPYSASSQLSTAIQTSLAWKSKVFGVKVSYKRIDPDYKSMGGYFFESDVQNILIAPNINLFNQALRLTGSFGLQKDNLYNTKQQQSQRIVSSAGLSFNQTVYGIDFKYSSYGITQYKGLNPLIDSMKIARLNNSYNGSGRLTFQSDSTSYNIIFIAAYQTLVDLNSRTAATSQSDNYSANLAYQVSMQSIGLNFGVNLNYIKSITVGKVMEFLGPTAQIGKTIDIFNVSSSLSYQFQTINSESSGGTASLNLQASCQLNKHNSLNLNINLIKSGNGSLINPSFTEYRSNLGYLYNF